VIGKAVAALDAFLDDDQELTLTELATRLRMSRSTVHRLLATLERHQLVDRTDTGAYRLGIHLFRLGSAVKVRAVLGGLAEAPLTRLAERFAVSSYLSVRDADRALCLLRIDRGPIMAATYQMGDTLSLHLGAGPITLLSSLPPAEVTRILAAPHVELTFRTTVDPAAIRARMATIRGSGVAYAADDVQVGLAAMGVPVRDGSGAVIAAVSVVALTPWFTDEHSKAMADALRLAAGEIEAQLSMP
jgi:DNA-binding IclR family transcriptional regulator